MKLNYQEQLPVDFHQDSRVWIYQSNRLFGLSEALHIEDMLNDFVANWLTHGDPVKGYANLFFGQFIVLMADESAGKYRLGCGIWSNWLRIHSSHRGIFHQSCILLLIHTQMDKCGADIHRCLKYTIISSDYTIQAGRCLECLINDSFGEQG